MAVNYVEIIPELSSPNVHIPDEAKLNDIIHNIILDGKDNVQLMSDFDLTLTKLSDSLFVNSFGLLALCPTISSKYLETQKDILNRSGSIVLNSEMSDAEKDVLLDELWRIIEEALRGEAVTCEDLFQTTKKFGPYLRDGIEELFNDLNEADVPILVFSAGYGDSVEAVLKRFNALHKNVKVVANFFDYDNGVIQGFKNTVFVNANNKHDLKSQDPEYIEHVKNRKNIVIMGDSLGDAKMAKAIPDAKYTLTIGFKCKDLGETMDDFLKTFDIVVEDGNTVNVVQAIFKHVLKN